MIPAPSTRVAFLRNVNQGQRGHVTTGDVHGAFSDAGVAGAVTFQSNGTVVFYAVDPDVVIADVRASIAARAGFHLSIFSIDLACVEQVVDEGIGAPDADRRELTLFDAAAVFALSPEVDAIARTRRCTVLQSGPGWAVTANERDRESNATPTIEQIIGGPASSRGMPTLVRLVRRFAR